MFSVSIHRTHTHYVENTAAFVIWFRLSRVRSTYDHNLIETINPVSRVVRSQFFFPLRIEKASDCGLFSLEFIQSPYVPIHARNTCPQNAIRFLSHRYVGTKLRWNLWPKHWHFFHPLWGLFEVKVIDRKCVEGHILVARLKLSP